MNQVINNFEALLVKGQDNAMIRYSLGNAYLQQKTFPLAVEHFARALTFDPLYSAAWKGYAKALANNQQIPEAIAAYQRGIVVADEKGDKQTVKEMTVFLKRLQSQTI